MALPEKEVPRGSPNGVQTDLQPLDRSKGRKARQRVPWLFAGTFTGVAAGTVWIVNDLIGTVATALIVVALIAGAVAWGRWVLDNTIELH